MVELRLICPALATALALLLAMAPSARAAPPPSAAADQYALAADHYQQNRWRQAADEFRAFVERFPSDAHAGDALFYEAEALMQLQEFQKAQQIFETLLAQNQSDATTRRALFRLGEALFLTGDKEKAAQRLDEFHNRFPDDPMIAYVRPYLGDLALQAGDEAKARELYTASLEQHPDGSRADDCRLGLARSFAAAGQSEQARRFFEYLVAGQGRLADDAAIGQLELALDEGDHVEVDRLAGEFAARFDRSPLALSAERVRGKSLLKRGDYAAAASVFEKLGAADSEAPLAAGDAYYLAVALLGQEKYETARAAIDAIDLNGLPENVAGELLSARGAAHAGLKDFPSAAADLERSLTLHPDSSDAERRRAQLAVSLTSAGELDRAEKVLSEMATGASDRGLFSAAARHFAETAYAQGQSARAEKWFAMLVEESPGGQASESAEESEEERAADAASHASSHAEEASPATDEASALAGLAWSQFRGGQFETAAMTFGRLADEHPEHALAPEALLMRGKSLEKDSRPTEAIEAFQSLVERFPNSDEHPEALFSGAMLIAAGAEDQEPASADGAGAKRRAAELLSQIEEEFPNYERLDAVLYERAWLLDDLGDAQESLEAFARLHADHRESEYWADATYRLAERAARAKDYARARQALALLGETESDAEVQAHALFLEGQIAAAEERWADVAAPLAQLLDAWPAHSLALSAEYWIAESLFHTEQYDEAAERLAALAEKAAGSDESWLAMVPLRRAQLLAREKKWDEAYELAAPIPRQFPEFRQLYEVDYLLGRCLGKRGEFSAARDAFERVLLSPEGGRTETAAMAQWMIGESFFHQQRYDDAIKAYDKVVASFDWPRWQAGALLQAGKCYELQGDRVEAEKYYARLLKEFPDTPFSLEAKERLNKDSKIGAAKAGAKKTTTAKTAAAQK
jgi:TolA-binding protein